LTPLPAVCYYLSVMYAIIEADGKQFRVSEGDTIRCDAIGADPGSEIAFDRVVLASGGGEHVAVGTPLVEGARVVGTIVRQAKAKKVLVFKYKPKKRVRKLVGHRQRYAEVKITRIELPA
jgi:large subunit ribosomal protein L21